MDADLVIGRAAATMPLGVDRRLVAVRRPQALAAKGAEALGGYAKSPNPATCLLLLADEALRASRDRRTDHWLIGAVPAAAIIELPTRGARDLAGWVRQRAALEGLTITDEAARLLVELTGEDTATLLGEARKAALAGGADNRNVGVKDVGSIVGEQRLDDIFDLTRAVERRDRAGALKMLDRLLATEDAMLLLTVLARDVRTAWTAVASTAILRLPPGTPLAGYGGMKRRLLFPDLFGRDAHAFWFKPSVGERDPMTVRALVLETPAARLAWVTLDLVAVDHALVAA